MNTQTLTEQQMHELILNYIGNLVAVTKDNTFDKEFRTEIKEYLFNLKTEIEKCLILYDDKKICHN